MTKFIYSNVICIRFWVYALHFYYAYNKEERNMRIEENNEHGKEFGSQGNNIYLNLYTLFDTKKRYTNWRMKYWYKFLRSFAEFS